jgi:hypothetical protein
MCLHGLHQIFFVEFLKIFQVIQEPLNITLIYRKLNLGYYKFLLCINVLHQVSFVLFLKIFDSI